MTTLTKKIRLLLPMMLLFSANIVPKKVRNDPMIVADF